MQTVVLTYDDVPPSFNKINPASGAGGKAYHRHKSRWEGIVAMLFMAERIPRRLKRVEVSVTMRFRTGHARDLGNFRVLIEKAAGDGLKKGGWLEDDDSERYSFTDIAFEEKGPNRTTLTVKYEK